MPNIKLNNSGMTLVEMIVVFALLGIMVVVGTQLITTSGEIYYQANSQTTGMQVSQIIVGEIRNELNAGAELALEDNISEAAMAGYKITDLKLIPCGEGTDLPEYPNWIVKLKLKITHPMYGAYETDEFIPIYSKRNKA